MKIVNFLGIKLLRQSFLPVLGLLLLSLTFFPQSAQAQQPQLKLSDILVGLRSKKVPLDERNRLLTDAVKVRGITFSLTPEIETVLQESGATRELVEAVRQKSPVVKVVITPAPTPAPTPKPPDYAAYKDQADEQMVKGDYDSAVASYSKVIELNPKNAPSYLSRGLSYYNKKNYDLAISDYNKGIELSPGESIAYYNRGNAYEQSGDIPKAITDYQKAVALDAKNETAKNSLKRLQDAQAKAEQAKAEQTKTFVQPRPTAPTNQPKETPKAEIKQIDLGQLGQANALRMASPIYSPEAKRFKMEGQITVWVSLDEEGNVVSAKSKSGPGMLRTSAEEAARRSKFKPALEEGKPVKATGFIIYNFKTN